MKHWKAWAVLLLVLAGLPAGAYAQWAYTAKDVNLRAGPARDFPLVARLPRGLSVSVAGCLSDFRWCDVVAGPNRGWVYAGNLVYPYQGARVPVLTYGTVIGLGIVAFSVARYWDAHYVGRPWYRQRQVWVHRPPPAYRPPPGYRPGGPPPHRPPEYRPPGHRPGGPPPPGFGEVAIGHRRRDTGRVGTPGRRTASDREAADALPLIGHRPPIGRTARRGRRPARGRREAGAQPRVSSLGAARARRMAREVASARTNSGPERDALAAVRPADGRTSGDRRRQPGPQDSGRQAGASDAALKTARRQGIAAHVVGARVDQFADILQAALLVGLAADEQEDAVFEGRGVPAHPPMHAQQPARVADVVADDECLRRPVSSHRPPPCRVPRPPCRRPPASRGHRRHPPA